MIQYHITEMCVKNGLKSSLLPIVRNIQWPAVPPIPWAHPGSRRPCQPVLRGKFAGLKACRLCTCTNMILCRPCFFLPCFQNGDKIKKDFQENSVWAYPAIEMSYFQLFSFTLFCFMFKKSLQLIYCKLCVISYIIF